MTTTHYTSLEGKTAIVTGGAQGLGLGSSVVLAEAGARVLIFDIQAEKAQEAAASLPGSGHEGFSCDVTDAASRRAALQAALEVSPHLDILVNNAGTQYHSPAEEIDEDKWRQLMALNIDAVMFMARDVGQVMLQQRSGSIINIGSIASVLAMPRRTPYTATKTAVIGITRGLAVEWAGRGVRVNAVCPGYHETALLMEYVQRGALDLERIRRRIPMGRLGSIYDVGKAVLFFASELSAYVTGQALLIDGGYTAFGAPEDASE